MNDRVQWCVVAVPAPGWAAKVFPELPVDEAVEKLWEVIFDVCRVSTGDPVTAWRDHVAKTSARRDQLNAWDLDRVHITSSNGTDLTVGIAQDATWEGASSKSERGIEFILRAGPQPCGRYRLWHQALCVQWPAYRGLACDLQGRPGGGAWRREERPVAGGTALH